MSKVKGYRNLSDRDVQFINAIKDLEIEMLREINALSELKDIDKRWLAIGKTQIEQGFMALVRSIAKPSYEQGEDDDT